VKIALIQPPLLDVSGKKISTRVEVEVPLGIAYLTAVLERDGHECLVMDAILEGYGQVFEHRGCQAFGLDYQQIAQRVVDADVRLVFISCIFFNQRSSALEVARQIRELNPGIKIVAGGIGAFVNPEWMLEGGFVDVVVIGEGEETCCRLAKLFSDSDETSLAAVDGIAYLAETQLVINPKRKYIADLDCLPSPAFHHFDLEKLFRVGVPFGNKRHQRYLNLLTSRGCPFDCVFCAAHNIWARQIRYRSAESILAEIRQVKDRYGIEEVHFSDENLTLDRQRAVRILQGLKELNLSWTAPNGLMIASLDEELIALMAESGCHSVSLAIESGSQRVLNDVVKKPLKLKQVFPVVQLLKKYGIHCRGFFILGLPGETRKEIWQTVLLSSFLQLEQNEIMIALPYPGTRLYDECQRRQLFSENFNIEALNNDGGPITTAEFTPDYLDLVKDVDRVLFYYRTKRKTLTEICSYVLQKYRLGSFRFLLYLGRFLLKKKTARRVGESYFYG